AKAALWTAAIGLIGASAFRGVCTMFQNYQGEAVGQIIGYELRMAFYEKLQHQSFAYHDHVHTGELMTRGILDIEGTRLWVDTGIARMVLLAVLIFGGAWVLASIDPVLAAVALAFVPIVAVFASVARLKLRTLWYRLQEELGALTQIMEENLGGIRVVRAFASQTFELARFDIVSKRAMRIHHHRIAVFVLNTTTMTYLFFLSMGLVLWIGGEKVMAGELTVGQLASFLAFMGILQMPVRQISWMVNSIARASTCGARVFEVIDLEPAIADKPGAVELTEPVGRLRFENVSFGYGGSDVHLDLVDISFEMSPGHITGIVGPPGSGKSTIAMLMPRFYEATGGRITLDGHDICDLTLESLRACVSVVQQDPFLFTTAVENNIAYADPWSDAEAIREASATAQLHDYLTLLPDGYQTLVGERGVTLSGGQRQRLAIARGILPEAKVMVFDDSTAAVDAGTEARIRSSLHSRHSDRAVLIIAHRLSSLMHANEILFLHEGRIVERGSHAQLVAAGGRYAELYKLQTAGDQRAPEQVGK
ncbi:MAG: ABC transporter ATP-binding protein, partial [Chromatiales bacterium]|nr:ABC transporter ATP-binding protein [Chromatiales bacterium]